MAPRSEGVGGRTDTYEVNRCVRAAIWQSTRVQRSPQGDSNLNK